MTNRESVERWWKGKSVYNRRVLLEAFNQKSMKFGNLTVEQMKRSILLYADEHPGKKHHENAGQEPTESTL